MEEEDEKEKREREERIARMRGGGGVGSLAPDEMGELPPERPPPEELWEEGAPQPESSIVDLTTEEATLRPEHGSLGAFTNRPELAGKETYPGSGEHYQDVREFPWWRDKPPAEVSPGEGKMSMRDAFRKNVIDNVFSGNDPYLLNPDDALEELELQYPEIFNSRYNIQWADRNEAPPEVQKDWSNFVLHARSDAFRFSKQGIDMRKGALDDTMKQFDETQGEKAKQERVREKEARGLQEWRTKEKEEEETQKRKEGRALETQVAKEGRVAKKEKEKPPKEPTSADWNMLNKFEKENTDPFTSTQEKMPEPLLRRWNRMRVSMGLPEMGGEVTQEAEVLRFRPDVPELWSYGEKEKPEVEPTPTAPTPTATAGGDNIKAELGYWKFLNESQSPDKVQKVKSAFRDQYGYVPTRIPMQYRQMFQ
jgi:hypothetical protein